MQTITREYAQAKTKNKLGSYRVAARADLIHGNSWDSPRKVRVHWSNEFSAEAPESKILGEQPEITRKGDDEESDKAWRAYNRNEVATAKSGIIPVLSKMVRREVHVSELRFSRNAGCSMCPCSPGFVAGDELSRDLRRVSDATGIAQIDVKLHYFAG